MKMKSRIEEINRQSSDLIAILAKVSTIKIYEDRIEELKNKKVIMVYFLLKQIKI